MYIQRTTLHADSNEATGTFCQSHLYLWSPLSLFPLLFFFLFQFLVFFLDESDECIAPTLKFQGSPRLDKPVKPELRSIANSRTYLIVDILLVKAKLMEHTNLSREQSDKKKIHPSLSSSPSPPPSLLKLPLIPTKNLSSSSV